MARNKSLTIQLVLPGDLPSLNKWQAWHWAKRKRFKDKLAHDLHYLLLFESTLNKTNIREIGKLCRESGQKIQIRMRRYYDGYHIKMYDHDNFIGGCSKPLMDALQVVGILSDDSQKYLDHGKHEQIKDSLNPRFEVEILIPHATR